MSNVIYVGPSIMSAGIKQYDVFTNGIPLYVASLIGQYPEVGVLIVPIELSTAATIATGTPGTPEYDAYRSLAVIAGSVSQPSNNNGGGSGGSGGGLGGLLLGDVMFKSTYDQNGDGVVDRAEKLKTARRITVDGVSALFDGSSDVTITTDGGGGSGDMTKDVYDTNNNGVVDQAAKLQSPRNITLSGDASGSVSFDGSADVSITASIPSASTSAKGLMSAADKSKLDGVAAGANNYVHPANHPATMIVEDSTHRFVTDAEKATWNAGGGGGAPTEGIRPEDHGAVGNGTTDDTSAMIAAINAAITAKKPLILGAKTYKVTDTILNAVSKNNIAIYGQGMDISVISFSNSVATKPLIQMELCKYPIFRDFTILGSSQNGIGIKLGRYNSAGSGDFKWNAVESGQFSRVKTANLTIGIHYDAGWINDFHQCSVRDCVTGIKIHGNALNVHGITAVNNTIGIDVIAHLDANDENSTINFFGGGSIEANAQYGMRIAFAYDINLYGLYFENNPAGHIVAGTGATDRIYALNIYGGSLHYPHPLIFDRVDALSIIGMTELEAASPLTITDNVKQINIPSLFRQEFDTTSTSTIEAIEVRGKNRQSSTPWYLNDFGSLTVPANNTATLPLDVNGEVTIGSINGATLNEYVTDFITGNKSVKCSIPASKTHAGVSFRIKPTYLKSDYLSAKIPIFLGPTLDSFRIQVEIRYELNDSSLQSITKFDYIPAFAGDYGINKMLNRWMSYIVPINMEPVRSITNFRNILDINIYVYGVVTPASAGDEWLAVDSLEVYQTKYITNPYNDTRSNGFRPLEINPTIVNAEYFVQGGKRVWYKSSIPTSGIFNQGDYVKNTAPALSGGSVVKGWVRLTTGSAHVLGTDWSEDKSGGAGGTSTSASLLSPAGLTYNLTVSDTGTISATPTAIAYDLFDRADSATAIGAANLGGSWTAVQGTWGISSNQAYSVSDVSGDLAVLPTVGTNNHSVTAKGKGELGSTGKFHCPIVVVRYIDANNFLYVRLENSAIYLGKMDAGTATTLTSVSQTSTDNTLYAIKVVAKDGTITVYLDGVQKISYALTGADLTKFTSPTIVGLRVSKSGAPTIALRFDNFIVEPS